MDLTKMNDKALQKLRRALLQQEGTDEQLEAIAAEHVRRISEKQEAEYREKKRKEKRLERGGQWVE